MEGPWNMSDMSLLWRVPPGLPGLQVGTPSGHGSFTTAEVFDKASSWGSQWFSRQVSRRLKMGVECVEVSFNIAPHVATIFFILCQLLRMSFLFYNWVELAVSGSAQPSSMSLVRSQKASRRKAGDLSRIFCVQGHALLYSGCSCSGPGVSLAIANM